MRGTFSNFISNGGPVGNASPAGVAAPGGGARAPSPALLILLTLTLLLGSCKPAPPAPPAKAKTIAVASVGGWMFNQMGPFDTMVASNFPQVQLVPFGDMNAYLANVDGFFFTYPFSEIIAGGHSMGADEVCRAAAKIEARTPGTVRLVLLYEPVCMAMGKREIQVPPGVRCIVFRAEFHLGTIPAVVVGPHEEIYIPGSDHNNIIGRLEVQTRSRDEIAASL